MKGGSKLLIFDLQDPNEVVNRYQVSLNKKVSPYTSNGMGGVSPKNSNFTLGKLVGGIAA